MQVFLPCTEYPCNDWFKKNQKHKKHKNRLVNHKLSMPWSSSKPYSKVCFKRICAEKAKGRHSVKVTPGCQQYFAWMTSRKRSEHVPTCSCFHTLLARSRQAANLLFSRTSWGSARSIHITSKKWVMVLSVLHHYEILIQRKLHSDNVNKDN